IAAFPEQTRAMRNPLALRVSVVHNEKTLEIGLIPDLVFGLMFPDGSRRCFMVEIDRGTMPVSRSDFGRTSFKRKMQAYLAAYAAQQHERQFGWKTFRVLTVTTDQQRARSLIEARRELHAPQIPGPDLFFFATCDELRVNGPIAHTWRDCNGRDIK